LGRNRECRNGVVLIAVLVVVVLLSLASYQFVELMTSEYRAAESTVRAAQSRSLAISGVHYAAAALADKTTIANRLNSNLFDNESAFRGVLVREDDRPRYQGRFTLLAPPAVDDAIGGSTQVRYGVTDESGKININALVKLSPDSASNILLRLPNMTEEIADAIIDWINSDDANPRPNGAKNSYYTALSPGYRCKNGPLDSLEELLLVRGVTPELLFGSDRNRNGMPDPDEDSSVGFDPGWVAYLTIYSREMNVDEEGNARININDSADLSKLHQDLTTAVGQQLADFILLARAYTVSTSTRSGAVPQQAAQKVNDIKSGQQRATQSISSLYKLVNAQVSWQQGTGRSAQNITVYSPLNDSSQLAELLPTLLAKTTTKSSTELPAGINVMTAPRNVLMGLTGLGSGATAIEQADVDAITMNRPAAGSYNADDLKYQTTAWLLTDVKLSVQKMQTLEQYITSRSQTYRVQSMGYFDEGGPVTRVEAVIDTNNGQPRIIYFRDLTPLGRGYEVPR
jgi:hypothetical protein